MAQVDIVIKGTDNLSSTLKNIQKSQTAYRKDLESLDKELQELTQNHGNLAAELTRAKKSLSDAQKQFRATGDEADALNVSLKQMDVDNIQKNMRAVSKAMRSTERDMQSLTSSAQKMDNQLASTGTSGASGMGGLAGAVKSLAAAGLGNMLGGSVAGLAGSLVTSAFGSTTGGIVSSVAGNAVTGAAMGSILGPAGAAVGGLVGAISGAISGLTQAQEKADEVYRTYMQNIYTTAEETLQTWETEGSGVAASREMYGVSFRATMGEKTGQRFFENLQEYAKDTPFEFDPLVGTAQALMPGFKSSSTYMMTVLEALGDTASALGKSESDMTEMARALSKMQTTDKITQEYLSLLTERGVNAIDYLAEALGGENGSLSTAQIYDMISKGEIGGKQAVEIIVQGMSEDYEGATEAASKTFAGMSGTLADEWTDIENAFGEGYNEKRKEGMEAELAWFEEHGERLQEEAHKAGEAMAALDNEQQNQKLLAFEDMFDRIDRENEMLNNYAGIFEERSLLLGDMQDELLTDIGNNIGLDPEQLAEIENGGLTREVSNLNVYGELMEAMMLGDAGYNSSEVYSAYTDEVVNVIDSVQSAPGVETAAYNSGYYIAEELTEGIAAGLGDKLTSTISREIRNSAVNTTGVSPADLMSGQNTPSVKGYAVGLPYVPYDDFPALLHEGERVLTRSEAAAYDAGGGGIQIVVNGLSVREEADVSRIAQELARQLALTARSYTG